MLGLTVGDRFQYPREWLRRRRMGNRRNRYIREVGFLGVFEYKAVVDAAVAAP